VQETVAKSLKHGALILEGTFESHQYIDGTQSHESESVFQGNMHRFKREYTL
jgi:hypothetical protein